ncbi:uncharacterized protein [Branchiostoma lanceolatum]|uniref:uncharacterized protein n=1 Tax=Branchiostoma lanceolatum TaxID=7740 RepID=UPI0034566D96
MSSVQDLTDADIDAMKMGKLFRLLRDFGVNEDDLDDPNEARETLKQKFQELRKEVEKARTPEQVVQMMADVAKRYKTQRELLLQCCQDIRDYLPQLDQSERDKLDAHFQRDVMEILEDIREQLNKDECPLLVAGELSAGKSSFLNLLLGDDILPEAHLSSTSTICELKYGATRRAVVYLRGPDEATGSRQVTSNVDLSEDLQECRQQLARYIHLKRRDRTTSTVTKIEIFWPLDLLRGGVTIVDSPGVGESDMMDEIIARYIPSAFAFIYIIDSSRAGGVQQDRFGRLLLKCKDHGARSELEEFDLNKAIFVCNKWDQVPPVEREEVKKETALALGEIWKGLQESQIFIHSNKEALKGGYWSANYTKVLDGIYELLPKSLDHKVSTQYRRMVNILKEVLTYINLKRNDAYRNLDEGERHRVYREATSKLALFDEYTSHKLQELKDFLKDATEKLSSCIYVAVVKQKEGLRKHLPKDRMETSEAVGKLALAIEHHLSGDQEFKEIIKDAEERFSSKLQRMVNEVNHEYHESIRPVTERRCSLYVKTSPFQELIRQIKGNLRLSTGVTLDASKLSSNELDTELNKMAKNKLERSVKLVESFESDLQAMKEVDKRLIEDRFQETRSQLDLAEKYEPQVSRITRLLGRLVMVELTEMREYEFDLESIVGWPDPKNRIGGGSYGEVYRVQVQRDGSPVRAALKIGILPYDITTEENAWEFITEEDNLRKLKGDHIVEYYGTALRKEERGLRLGLIMELCEGTLEDRIIGPKEHNPTFYDEDDAKKQQAFRYIKNKAIQLCEGLRAIHKAGYIHRDLKLTNILVTAADVVKLADVGVTKREVDVTGTVTGTATYAAPEVKERKVYDKSADIYSLGLILWEMWYGQSVCDATHYLKGASGGEAMMMPHYPPKYIHPIPEWTSLVRDCMNTDATKRPTAVECLQRIRGMEMEDSPNSVMYQTTRI